jgi:FixJ family two-component response regulator
MTFMNADMHAEFSEEHVFVLDDDPRILRALARLLRAAGFAVETYEDPLTFLGSHDPDRPGCLLLDLMMPGLTGLELQRALAASLPQRPLIFLTGQGDVPSSVRAMKAGAIDFLTKPIQGKPLIEAVSRALQWDRQNRQHHALARSIRNRLDRLTPREREVLALVVFGRLNKQIAAELGTVEKTVKVHRSRMMAKMEVRSVAELVHLAEQSGQFSACLPPPPGDLQVSEAARGRS